MNTKRIFSLLILMIALSAAAFARSSTSIDMGNLYYKQFNFKKAVLFYEKALKHDKANTYLLQHIADSYRLMNNWPAARPYYQQLSADKENPLNMLYYAEALRADKDYPQAKIYYTKYLAVVPNDSSVREQLNWIDRTKELSNEHMLYQITNLKGINSPFSDFGVTMHGADDIYFCSNRRPDAYVIRVDNWTKGSFLKLYRAEVKDSFGTVKDSKLIASTTVNKKFHQGTPCYNEKLNELYFDRSNYNGKRAFFASDKTVKLKIFKVGWLPDANKWDGELKEAVPFNSRDYSVCHPSLNKGGDTLYFTSDMPGGYGRSDIYMSVRQRGGEWGPPSNLGPGINTSGDDMFPFIAEDGTLYFASDGHMGLGGLDIFSSKYEKGNWTEPKNIGAPINSNADDFGYVIKSDNKHGYFCSNRDGGMGDDDIYSFERKCVMVNGLTYNGYTREPIEGAAIEAKPTIGANILTAKEGTFSFCTDPNSDYAITAKKEGFHQANVNYHVTEHPEQLNIPMYPLGDIKLEVTVQDRKTHLPLDSARVKVTNLYLTKDEICYTNKEGKCMFLADTNTRYRIAASKETGDRNEKYINVSTEISTKGYYPPSLVKQLVELDKVKIGVPIKIENIYYDLDKWFIRPDAAIELNRLVKILADNPTMEIELSSHTDCRASAQYNLTLSKKRAQSAVEYIASQGINMKRMTSVGYGKSKLLNKCRCEGKDIVPCTEEEHQVNRRTEFKIKKF